MLAEDDDGLIGVHARIVLPSATAGDAFQLDACALHGGTGTFELRLLEGLPSPLSRVDRRAADLEDARKGVEVAAAALGEEHPTTAHNLESLGLLLEAQGDYAAARPPYERALAIREKALGDEHPDTATSRNNLGMLLKAQGDYTAARPLLERALATYEKALGEEHPTTAAILSNLAQLLQAQGDFAAARPLSQRALAIREKTLGAEHPATALSLNNLAQLRMNQGDYAAARPLLQRSLAIREKALGDEHPDTATGLNNLATLLQDQGDYAAARPLFERALAIYEKALGKEHPTTAAILSNLATLLQDQGDYTAARPLLQRSLAIREKALGDEHPDTATGLNNLALLLYHDGDLAAARPLLERALAIREKTLGEEHPTTAISLSNLAGLLTDQGNFAASRPLLERALAIREKALGDEHPDTAASCNNLAALLAAQGDDDAARPLLERTLTTHEKALGEEHPTTAEGLNNLVLLLLEQGDHDEALAHSRRAMQGQEAHRRRLVWSLTEAERVLLARTQRRTLEIFLSIPAGAAAKAGLSPYEGILAWKGQVLRSLTQSRGAAMATLSAADRRRVEQLQQLQAQVSKELFNRNVGDRDRHKLLLASLREQRNALELELTRSLGESTESDPPSVTELRSALPRNSVLVDFFIHRVYEPAPRDPTDKRIAAGAFTTPQLSAWIVKHGSENQVHRIELGDATPIETATRAFLDELVAHRGVTSVDPDADANEPSQANERLRELLWDPLREEVGDAALVIVSPDGFLGTLPFETLQSEDGSYLLEHHAFVYTEDAAVLVDIGISERSSTKAVATHDLFCVGNVDYRKRDSLAWRNPSADQPEEGATASAPSAVVAAAAAGPASSIHGQARGGFPRRWTSLPATNEEARAISEIHEDTFETANSRLTLLGDAATEERLKYELPRHDIIHLATHGFFQPEGLPSMWRQVMADDGKRRMKMFEEEERIVGLMPGLLSGLVLAGANRKPSGDRDDGFLTAEEISFLDLSGVELVVLSACETALGKSEAGEGMLGLRRTFRQSGARTVISSLWKVSDQATSQLMQNFYERLWLDGNGSLDALRGAQLDMLKANRIENDGAGLPSTWGAFVLDGAWR